MIRGNHIFRSGAAAMALVAATGAAMAASVHDQLDALYQRDAAATVELAERLLTQDANLGVTDRIEAQAYLCESLEDLDRFDDAAARAAAAIAALPATPPGDAIEPSARLLACAGFLAKQQKRFAEAMADLDRAQALLDPKTMGTTLSYVLYRRAGLHDTLGDHAAALGDLARALQLLPDDPTNRDDEAQRNNIASAIARIHLHRREYAAALPYYLDTLRYTQRIQDEHAEAVIQLNLGECYRGLDRREDAARAYARALDVGTQREDRLLIGRAEAGLGALARMAGDYPTALAHFAAAHAALTAQSLPLDAANADLERAEVLADLRDWPALAKLADALIAAVAGSGDKRLLRRAYELRARAAEGRGELAAALADTRAGARLQDEIHAAELADELAKRTAQFDVAKLESQTRLLARENELARLQIEHEHDVNLLQRATIAVAGGVVLLLALSVRRHVKVRRLLTRLASEDALTGLGNRRATLAAAAAAFAAARHDATSLSLALLDIDHFKSFNDRHGHAVGDAVLIEVARCLRAHLRAGDVCGRIGGEEFLLALPGCAPDHAVQTLERLRTAATTLRVAGLPEGEHITLSAGVAHRSERDASLDALMQRADAALYAAKHAGRDRVAVSDVTGAAEPAS
jgi:diguanylate cyclase (GGDEF)-like protein